MISFLMNCQTTDQYTQETAGTSYPTTFEWIVVAQDDFYHTDAGTGFNVLPRSYLSPQWLQEQTTPSSGRVIGATLPAHPIATSRTPGDFTVELVPGTGLPVYPHSIWVRVTCPDEYLGIPFQLVPMLIYWIPDVVTAFDLGADHYAGTWMPPRWGIYDADLFNFPGDLLIPANIHTEAYEDRVEIGPATRWSVVDPPSPWFTDGHPTYNEAWTLTGHIVPDYVVQGYCYAEWTYQGQTVRVQGILKQTYQSSFPNTSAFAGQSPIFFNPADYRRYEFPWPFEVPLRNPLDADVTVTLFDEVGRYSGTWTQRVAAAGLSVVDNRHHYRSWKITGGQFQDGIVDDPLYIRFFNNSSLSVNLDPSGPPDIPGVIMRVGTRMLVISRLCRVHTSDDEGDNWNYIMTISDAYILVCAAADDRRGLVLAIVTDTDGNAFQVTLRPQDNGTFTQTVEPMIGINAGAPTPAQINNSGAFGIKPPASLNITGATMTVVARSGEGTTVYTSVNEGRTWNYA